MKRFSDWDWRIKILGPVVYSSVISGFFAYDYVIEKNPIKLVGLTLIIVGYTFMLIARFQLKDKFSILPEVKKGFCTKGMYKIFRHPTYTFSSMAAVGIYLCIHANYIEWQYLIAALILFIYLAIQCQRAESRDGKFLQAYPEEYVEYMKKTTWF